MWRVTGVFFFFNDTATTEIYTLSLHDALPISGPAVFARLFQALRIVVNQELEQLDLALPALRATDRKSTRLNSSHDQISYAVFCLKKKTRQPLHQLRSWLRTHHLAHRRFSPRA